MNIYAGTLKRCLPRLMTLYDWDPFSPTHGWGDRRCWGWKTIDFSNGAFQGGAYALAAAVRLWPEEGAWLLKLLDAVISALPGIRRRNGSLEEAFPNENSFCATAAAAADCLAALDCLKEQLGESDKSRLLRCIAPLISYIEENDEYHAMISNHLAAAVAASFLWRKLGGGTGRRGRQWLERIYAGASAEGWFREYEGADPGYQTLCGHYLALALASVGEDSELEARLRASALFMQYFVHPDGSIGGLYGSRNTEVYYPSGIVCFSHLSPLFADMAKALEAGIEQGKHITPDTIDADNFIPLLNAYAAAALYDPDHPGAKEEQSPVGSVCFEKEFPEAGLFIKSTEFYYAVINYRKGGVLKVFDRRTGRLDLEDGGVFGRMRNGGGFSTQVWDQGIGFDRRQLTAGFYRMDATRLTPFIMIITRILGLSLFYSGNFREWFKRRIVQRLMTGKRRLDGVVKRQFEFMEDRIRIKETIIPPRGAAVTGHFGKAKGIHMASSGYYTSQLRDLEEASRIVEFIQCGE